MNKNDLRNAYLDHVLELEIHWMCIHLHIPVATIWVSWQNICNLYK